MNETDRNRKRTDIHDNLLKLAEKQCLPYLLQRPEFMPVIDDISFVLVGSVATGLCREDSDIDIAIISRSDYFSKASQYTQWSSGIPTETWINGVQLHYYSITFDVIESKLKQQDDMYIYVYSYAKPLRDPDDAFTEFIGKYKPDDPTMRKQRVEGKIDMMLRRTQALDYTLKVRDLFGIMEICKELIALTLKITALLDNVPFEPRKRLFQTSLQGNLGLRLKPQIITLFTDTGSIGQLATDRSYDEFLFSKTLSNITKIIIQEAKKQGYTIGLNKPDYRHAER